MNSHRQLCGLALAVNLVADHWTLLIVRELLPGPRRFSDLRTSLAPVASNLLAARLRQMVADGLVKTTVFTESPAAAYALTDRGRGLREAVGALVRWAIPEVLKNLGQGLREDPRWLMVALPALVGTWKGPPLRVRIEVDPVGFVLVLEAGREPELAQGAGEVTVRGPYAPVLGLFSGVVQPGVGAGSALQITGESPGWTQLLQRSSGPL